MNDGRTRWGILGLVVGLIVGSMATAAWMRTFTPPSPAVASTATEKVESNPALRTLDANLYVQISPEYRALCLQIYRNARETLPRLIAEARDKDKTRPPAVIMDLDETVLDNSPFQSWLYEHQTTYSPERWLPWESEKGKETGVVPGAVAFIAEAERLGATVFYITNRSDKAREGTAEALRINGINTANLDKRLLLKGKTSDKTERRAQVAQTYSVVMLLGDTLTDFDQQFASKWPDNAKERLDLIADRKAKVDAQAAQWGTRWIVLPNPVYGEFARIEPKRALELMKRPTLPAPAKPADQ
jgi:5'-nucleotidase (lipoprotein e(P4) family)